MCEEEKDWYEEDNRAHKEEAGEYDNYEAGNEEEIDEYEETDRQTLYRLVQNDISSF
jgi:hypothetical protein